MNESTDPCQDLPESAPVEATQEALGHGAGVAAEFRVFGLVRYLSHAELMRVFQRACVRADLALEYSHGYNPRPRLSLPLPKPVGVESEGDLLCLRLLDVSDSAEALAADVARRLSSSLPHGLEILSVRTVPRKTSYQPEAAVYRFLLKAGSSNDELRSKAEALLARGSLVVERRDGDNRAAAREVDVRPFLEALDRSGHELEAHCRICPNGSIRVGEILGLLGMTREELAGPIRRTAIRWRQISVGC